MEDKLKYLEFIQAVISRMAANSFLVKGWSVTLVAAIFALAAKEANQNFILVVYLPILSFWMLDAFFLSREKKYRILFKNAAVRTTAVTFDMDARKLGEMRDSWFACIFSSTILFFHGVLLLVTIIVTFENPNLKKIISEYWSRFI